MYLYKYVTKALDFSKTLFESIKKRMVLRLMRSWNIENVATYVIKMVAGGYMALIYTVKCLLLKDYPFIC